MFEMCADPSTLDGFAWFACYLTTGKLLAFYASFGVVALLLAITAPSALLFGFAGASAARDSLSQVLVADGYTNAASQSYLAIPYDFNDPSLLYLCISLHSGPTAFSEVTMPPSQVSAEMLYTLWDIAVATGPTTWGEVKALYR